MKKNQPKPCAMRRTRMLLGIESWRRTALTLLFAVLTSLGALAKAAIIDLSTVTTDICLQDGAILTGTLDVDNHPVKISIAAGATVTLSGANIIGKHVDWDSYQWAGLTCEGDATIILANGTANNVTGFNAEYAGIFIPSGKTLVIRGGGLLKVSSNCHASAIGACYGSSSGGIGDCGNIIIDGGIIIASGGYSNAAIGGSNSGSCGTITITKNVQYLYATILPGSNYSIGSRTCGTVTIGCTLDSNGTPVDGTVGPVTANPSCTVKSRRSAATLTSPRSSSTALCRMVQH